jgi:hypothetical protein
MHNHVHLAIQVGERPLGALMQVVASRYARCVQRAVPTSGHLFERRYRATLVDRDDYLLALVRYIHLNPVRAGLAGTANGFRWSSHHAYLGAQAPPWLTTDLIRALFGAGIEEAVAGYRRFMAIEPDEKELDRLRRGWADDALRIAHDRPSALQPRPGAPQVRRSLEHIIEAELAGRGISLADLTGPGKHRALSTARAAIIHQALTTGAATLTELASKLNRSPATLSVLMRRFRTTLTCQ